MDFISNTKWQIQEMLATIGVERIEDLFSEIPEKLIIPRPSVDDGVSEYDGMRLMESIAAENTAPSYDNYLGAGSYEHHVPALVGPIISRSEFLTAYTPYQAEASQGLLQAIFEFQSAVCGITGLDIANASVYNGASACVEAILMTLRVRKKRAKILISESLHPHYRAVINQHFANTIRAGEVEIMTIPMNASGAITPSSISKHLNDQVAAILLQYPSFIGRIDDLATCFSMAQENGTLSIVCANPLAYGLFQSADELGADIAVGDLQPLGMPMQFGGPYVGYMACREALTRQMPGRLVSETIDTQGRRGFVLALQAREQHIRREKATSNICSNQNLTAMAALITLLWYGPIGLKKLAITNYQRAAYLRNELSKISSIEVIHKEEPTFNEFILRFDKPVKDVVACFKNSGIIPGLDLSKIYKQYTNCLLVAVTETKSKEQLDRYIAAAREATK